MDDDRYSVYRDVFGEVSMPLAFVELDALIRNSGRVAEASGDRTVRVVTKSIRSVELLRRILKTQDCFQGLMAFSAEEARYLSENGFEDILVAYPVWNTDGIELAADASAAVTLTVSSVAHVERVGKTASELGETVPLCIDIDMSVDYPGLRFGVYRSGIRTPDETVALAEKIKKTEGVRLKGVLGYEAQIAGVADRNPSRNSLTDAVVRKLKRRSLSTVRERRGGAVEALEDAGYELSFVNGGGTGSMEFTARDDSVTEVAVGSGFYYPSFFDGYDGLDELGFEPAAGYAVEVTRNPTDCVYTCAGGGYVASGPAGEDKVPEPVLPDGSELTHEGAGEVQTPVRYDGDIDLQRGDPVVFRHAKAGELCERFEKLHLLRGDEVTDEATTYRGDGRCFM
jgi:D-serine deaminase-like pyridoxal phosphate-dependent protein